MFNQIPYMMANPAYAMVPNLGNVVSAAPSSVGAITGSGTSLLSKINWSSLLSNAQKTLNVVNQAIPLYYQVKPVFNNIKTLGRIGKEFVRSSNVQNTSNQTVNNENNNVNTNTNNDNISKGLNSVPTPTFFL